MPRNSRHASFCLLERRFVSASPQAPQQIARQDQVNMIVRAFASGSSAIRHSLSQTIVLLVSGSVGCHFRPGMLGSPFAAKESQEAAIFFANTCASGVLPVPCSQRFVLSKQN